jgi:hypothetical protein
VVGAPSHEQAMSDFASEIVRFWSMTPPNAHPSFGEGRRNLSIDEDLQPYLT